MNRRTTTFLIIALLVILGAVWIYWMATKSSDQLEAGVTVATGDNTQNGELSRSTQLIRVLENIESIDLNNRSILSNENFNRLQDYGRALEDRLIGRSNPFAPIGTANLSQSTNNSATDESKPKAEVKATTTSQVPVQVEAEAESDGTFE